MIIQRNFVISVKQNVKHDCSLVAHETTPLEKILTQLLSENNPGYVTILTEQGRFKGNLWFNELLPQLYNFSYDTLISEVIASGVGLDHQHLLTSTQSLLLSDLSANYDLAYPVVDGNSIYLGHFSIKAVLRDTLSLAI